MSGLAITLLSTLRFTVGVVGFLGPSTTAKLMGHPAPASSVISNRLWASRDGILAGLLFSASSDESVRLALLGGITADVLDIVSVALGLLDGSVGTKTAVAFGGGAMAFVGLGLVALNGLESKKI
jgi:hypothetical protein